MSKILIDRKLLERIHRDLDACQKVIWLRGGFDPAYCNDAQDRLKEIDELLEQPEQQPVGIVRSVKNPDPNGFIKSFQIVDGLGRLPDGTTLYAGPFDQPAVTARVEALEGVKDCLVKALTGGAVPAAKAGKTIEQAELVLSAYRTQQEGEA